MIKGLPRLKGPFNYGYKVEGLVRLLAKKKKKG